MSNTNNIIIQNEDPNVSGSGSGDITGPVQAPETTPNLIDADTLNLIPLSDTTPSANDILLYDGTLYVPTEIALAINTDVTLTSPSNNEVLVFNDTSNQWENKSLAGLIDDNIQFDSIATPAVQDILSYNGTKWVPIDRASLLSSLSLSDLNSVTIDTQLDKQLLTYNSTTSQWENKTLSFYDLDEINASNPSSNQFLVYNSTSSKWEPTTLTADDISNFSTAATSDKDILQFDNSTGKWEPKSFTDFANQIPEEIDLLELKDVTITNALDKNFLSWDSALQNWINYQPSLVDLSDYNSSNNPTDKDILTWDNATSTWKSTSLTSESLFGYSLGDVAEGKILIYNDTTNKWEPKYLTLGDLVDASIDLGTLSSGTSILWDSTNSKWEFKKLTLEDILGFTGVGNEEILAYNSSTSKWENKTIASLISSTQTLDSLDDTILNSPSGDQFLVYNTSSNKWENKTINLGDINNIELAGLTNKNFLAYNSISSKWEPKSLSLESLAQEGINPSTIPDEASLYWNSTATSWEFKVKTREEILNFPNNTPNQSVMVYNSSNNMWETDLVSNLISFSNNINSLLDVDITNLSNTDLLVYNSSSSKWESQAITLDFITDVNLAGLQDENMLSWNSTASRWEPRNIVNLISSEILGTPLTSLSDVELSSLENNELIYWDSTTSEWKNSKLKPESFLNLDLSDQTNGRFLTWNFTSSQWEFQTYTLEELINIDGSSIPDKGVMIWNSTTSKWDIIESYELNEHVAPEIDLGELKNVDAPNKLNNQVLTWDSALQQWIPKNLNDLGVITDGNLVLNGNDWVTLFNNTLNY